MATEQNLSNHTRRDPTFIFAGLVAILTFIGSIVHEVRHPTWWHLWMVIAVGAAVAMLMRVRVYATMNQDRVIRLEERLRLSGLMAEPYRSRIDELTLPQMIALRFASDGEAAGLAERALTSNLTGKQIKESIQVWRPDHHRV